LVTNYTWIIRELTFPDLISALYKSKKLLWQCLKKQKECPKILVLGPWKEGNRILWVEVLVVSKQLAGRTSEEVHQTHLQLRGTSGANHGVL
jgi:hypothetical protein